MRNLISYTALGVALAGGVSVAQAQTVDAVIAPQPIVTTVPGPVVTAPPAPVETVETVRTVRSTTRPAHRFVRARDRVTTTRTTISERVVPAPVAPVAAIPPDYPRLYDVVTPGPAVAPIAAPLAPAAAPLATVGATTVVPSYRYVYEPDRILVIDPYTNVAVQAIPR